MPRLSPFSNGPQIRRAPLAPLQRRVGALRNPFVLPKPSGEPPVPQRPFVDTGENPEAQGAFGGQTVQDFANQEGLDRRFRTEAALGTGVKPVVPGLPLARRFVGREPPEQFGGQRVPTSFLDTGALPQRDTGRNIFTNEPLLSQKLRRYTGKDANGRTIEASEEDVRALAEKEGLSFEDYVSQFGLKQMDNPDFAEAEAGLSEPERDFRKFGGEVPASFGGGTKKPEKPTRARTAIEPAEAHNFEGYPPGYVVRVEYDAAGNVISTSLPSRPPTDFQAEEETKRAELGRKENQEAYEVALDNWKQLVSNRGEANREQAERGGFNAFQAQVASGAFQGTDPRNQQAIGQNEAFARQETTRLRALGDSSQAATQILQDFKSGALATKPPAVRQAVLQALRSYQGQRDAEGNVLNYSDAIKALEQSLQPQGRRPFVTVAGTV